MKFENLKLVHSLKTTKKTPPRLLKSYSARFSFQVLSHVLLADRKVKFCFDIDSNKYLSSIRSCIQLGDFRFLAIEKQSTS